MFKTAATIAILLAAAAHAPQAPPADAVSQFAEMERNLAAAYMRGDRAFVDDLLADDWTSTDYTGRLWTKANVLALFGPGGPTFTKSEIDVDRVRLVGDVAIVTGRSVSAGRFEGRDISVTQRYMDIYVKRDGRWRVVNSQGTEIR
jgi:ketosteroid isomerase-like protein